MARTTKPTKTVESAPVIASVAPVVVAASSEEVKTTKVKKTKAVKPVASEASVSAPVVAAPSTTVSAPVIIDLEAPLVSEDVISTETPLTEQSIEFLAKLQQLSVLISSLKTEYRVLEKKWTRELKSAQKLSSRRKRKSGNRAPSGFVKPTRISDELASFLGKEKGTEMARTSVTRDINAYIRANKLQDSDNGRKINPDAKLAALLKLNKSDELTYFNLQRFMSPHFSKNVKAEEVVASV